MADAASHAESRWHEPRLRTEPGSSQSNPSQNFANAQTLQIQNAQNAPELQNYFFRVEGTNRSLNQRVIVTGNLLQNNVGNIQNADNNNNSQAFRIQQNVPTGNQYNSTTGSRPRKTTSSMAVCK